MLVLGLIYQDPPLSTLNSVCVVGTICWSIEGTWGCLGHDTNQGVGSQGFGCGVGLRCTLFRGHVHWSCSLIGVYIGKCYRASLGGY